MVYVTYLLQHCNKNNTCKLLFWGYTNSVGGQNKDKRRTKWKKQKTEKQQEK